MNMKKIILVVGIFVLALVGCRKKTSSSELLSSSDEPSNIVSSEPSSEEPSSFTSTPTQSSQSESSEPLSSEPISSSSKPSSSEPTSSEPSSSEPSSSTKPSSSEPVSSEPTSSEPSSSEPTSSEPSSSEPSSSETTETVNKEQEFDFYRTVTFDPKNGSAVETVEVLEGDVIDEPNEPSNGDYEFLGWFLDGEEYDFSSPVYFDITLVAKWEGAVNSNVKKVNFSNSLTADGLTETGPLTEGCLPSYKVNTENPKILVFPVRLNSSYNQSTYATYLEDINTAFNGTSEETGWESVKTFYQKSSYGKLNLDITIWDEWFYDSSISASSLQEMNDAYYAEESNIDPNEYLLTKILDKYNSSIDYSDYDSNNDGFIDSIWVIYDEEVNFEDDKSMYWAYTSWDYEWYDESYDDYINPSKARDGVYPFYYAWAGTDFMYPSYNNAEYNVDSIEIDAHTYIHETGHLLGLDDYYDYDSSAGVDRGLYGADMMDYNIGDHGVISKLLLDWVDPFVAEDSGKVSLQSFTETGDCLIVADHELDDIYDTYYIIEFYTNTGLNANDEPIPGGLGVRITLVHAEINIVNGNVEWNDGTYSTSFKYDNSDSSIPFVEMLSHKTISDGTVTSSHLFTEGKSFTSNVFDLEVVSISSTEAIVNINLK